MRKEIAFAPLLILAISLILAAPSLPHEFRGNVIYSGDSGMSLTGHDISASIGTYGLGIVGQVGQNNQYDVFIDTQGRVGEIHFFVGGNPNMSDIFNIFKGIFKEESAVFTIQCACESSIYI